MNLITKIKSIVQGKYRTLITPQEKIPEWVQKRRDICSHCPFNTKNTPIFKRGYRWYYINFLNTFRKACYICTCSINDKTFSELESCPKGFWNSKM